MMLGIERHDTVVIGAGQAGLATSCVLTREGREHVVLERGRVGERWRTERWDSLRFQFPNWTLQLPGYRYAGDDPDGFAHYTKVHRLVEEYAGLIDAPVREGTEVISLAQDGRSERFIVTTGDGPIQARRVVVATGPFHRPRLPRLARDLPAAVHQSDPTRYRGPAELPDGGVLVVGSGASGYQIADELLHAERPVYLSVSPHRRVPRRLGGKDVYWWFEKLGRFDVPIDSFPDRRWPPSTVVTGVNGGYDVDVRSLAAAGVRVLGRAVGAADGNIGFDASANDVLAEADASYDQFLVLARGLVASGGAEELVDDELEIAPKAATAPIEPVESIDLTRSGISTVIWATGYAYDYDWLQLPVFDAGGRPIQRRGVTECPGLYFLGLHWMHTFRSGLLSGVGHDAEYIAEHMARSS